MNAFLPQALIIFFFKNIRDESAGHECLRVGVIPPRLPPSQPRCIRFNASSLRVKPDIVERPEELFCLPEDPACVRGDGRNRLGKNT